MARLRRRRRGFSVIEMMVALTITLVALTITAELILESQRRIAHSGRRNLDMSVDLAFDQMRLDVRGSTGFEVPLGMTGSFNDGAVEPLALSGHYSGDTIVYELVSGDLRRVIYRGADLTPVAQRIVLQRVGRFRWRNLFDAQRVLEVTISHQETADMTRRVAAGQREALEPNIRTVTMMLVPRAGFGKKRW